MSFFIFLFLAILIIVYEAVVNRKQIFQTNKKKNKANKSAIWFIDIFLLNNKKKFRVFITLVLFIQICVYIYFYICDFNLIDNLIRNNLEFNHITLEASYAVISFIILISIALIMFPYLSRNKIENSSYKYICCIENISVILFVFFLGSQYLNCIGSIYEGRKDFLLLFSTVSGALLGVYLTALFSFLYDATFWYPEILKDSCFRDDVGVKKVHDIRNVLDKLKEKSKYFYLISVILFIAFFVCLSFFSESHLLSFINKENSEKIYFLLSGFIIYSLTKYYENA